MTPDQWNAIRPILETALELPLEERDAYLNESCSDAAMRDEIESLLASHDRAGAHVLSTRTPASLNIDLEARFRIPVGRHVGVYKILDEIAVGGMGAVYRAARDDGHYRQEVALKIVRTELGGELGSARFRNERQILASLDHPNIAKILDGGTTAEGIPFLVMELIDGLPITEYCDRCRCSIAARIELFRAVCSAVHYAHQRLVIHRDIKPGNILVTAQGIPKLLDFGIAKILDPHALAENGLTVAGTTLMTPEYASPEQLLGASITTATDVYSLGCILYELLTGHRALNPSSRRPHDIAQAVLQQDPEKPSSVVLRPSVERTSAPDQDSLEPGDVSQLRGETPRKLQRRLRGDLDNIVMCALRKESAARYLSVDQLSEDLRRCQRGEPVQARRSTLGYQFAKFVARHKIAVAATATVFATIVIGLIVTLYEARVAREHELRAEQRFNDVRKLANSLVFEVHDSIRGLAGATAARKLIIQRAQEYLESLATEANTDPGLMRELASAYAKLGRVLGDPNDANIGDANAALLNYRKATTLLEAAVVQKQEPVIIRELAESYYRLATRLALAGDASGRKSLIEKAVSTLEQLSTAHPNDRDARYDLGIAYGRLATLLRDERDLPHALDYFRKAHAIYDELSRAYPDRTRFVRELSHSHRHLGTFFAIQRQYPQALEHYRAASAIDAAQLALNPESLEARFNATLSDSNLGFVLGEQGDVDAALGYYRKVLDARSALLAADPQDNRARTAVSETLEYLGVNLIKKQDYAAARDCLKRALVTWEEFARKEPTNKEYAFEVAWTQADLGQAYAAMALKTNVHADERLKLCRESREWYQKALPRWLEGQTEVKLGVGGATGGIL